MKIKTAKDLIRSVESSKHIPFVRYSMSDVAKYTIKGDKRNPEPSEFRLRFPGGTVSVVRTSGDDYWVHVSVCKKSSDLDGEWEFDGVPAKITKARLDIDGKHAKECSVGDFANPDLYHLAVLVERIPNENQT